MSLVTKELYPAIPVSQHREKILAAIQKHQVIVVVGDTGSGKTTQLPKMALEYVETLPEEQRRLVGCTQPRRIAAASVAKRVAEELKVESGEEVGYQVRFEDKTSKSTRLKFMTDGILLAETQGDRALKQYSVLIIDEAHERSLNIDFLLGYLNRLTTTRKDLRVIISSATLDSCAFADFFDEAPIIEVEGRTFPVETHYLPPAHVHVELSKQVVEACEWVKSVDHEGDILIFLPGEREIRECADILEGMRWGRTAVLPLFARLNLQQQQQVFKTIQGTQRIVLATNVAETSLTIPGIVYVIDSGVARVSRWNPSRQVQRLQIEPVSQASARQRKGRCGRVREGVCVRLYEEEDHDARAEYTDPEIRRSSLAGVILRMKSLKLPDIEDFPFLDPPSSKHVAEGYRTLREIGALTEEHRLTEVGRNLSRLPIEPRMGKMLLEANQFDCLAELLIIVSGLSIMDPRERPLGKEQQAEQAQAKWKHKDSDFLSLLQLWLSINECRSGKHLQKNQLRKICKTGYLNFRRVIEWDNLLSELTQLCKKALKLNVKTTPNSFEKIAHADHIHKAILAGIPKQVGVYDRDKRSYRGAQGREFSIFPGSHLFSRKKLDWVLAYEIVETSKLWSRRNAVLNPEWVEEVAPHLCKKRWHSAFFDEKQGAVYAKEVVSLGNLPLVKDRPVHFGKINEKAAREVFIREGLLLDKIKSKPPILKHLKFLREQVDEIEQKLRRVDGIWSEELLVEWFNQKLPVDCYTAKKFITWANSTQDALTLQDTTYEELEELRIAEFPDELVHAEQSYPLYYKVAPGEGDDGITIGVHIDQLSMFSEELLGWGVQGDLVERVEILIRSLPKALRIACNPVRDKAEQFTKEMHGLEREEALYTILARFLSKLTGERISGDLFDSEKLPSCLQMKIWVCDDEGQELGFSSDINSLKESLADLCKERFEDSSSSEWDYTGLTAFDCEPLPKSIEKPQGLAFPALIDEGQSVGVKVFACELEAADHHRKGVIRLFLLQHFDHAKHLSKKLPLSIEGKMYLPLLGESGVDQTAVLRWVVEHALGSDLPRTAEAFTAAADKARGDLFDSAERVCRLLDDIIALQRRVEKLLGGWRGDKNFGEIAEDIDEQMHWLLRAEFSKQIDIWHLQSYKLWFEGMVQRIERAESQPLMKDLEKMDTLLEFWTPWYERWLERKSDHSLIALGQLMNHLRTSVFAASIQLPEKVSQKLIRKKMETLGLS